MREHRHVPASGRVPAGRPRAARAAALVAVAAAAWAATGCATMFAGSAIGPDGRSTTDARLRAMVSAGHADSALAWIAADPGRLPGDDLLDCLYYGALAHDAGRYEESSLWLRAAYELAEDRYTKSATRSALSLLANDAVMPYEPGETERMLIHYYNAKNHLALGDLDGAAVEARRLSLLLDRYDDASATTATRAAFRAFASAVFAAAGEWNDADVAARKAAAQGARWADYEAASAAPSVDAEDFLVVPLHELAAGPPDARASAPGDAGRVLVVVEHGRVAQRVEQTSVLFLDDDERDHLHRGGRRRAFASMELAQRLDPSLPLDGSFLAALADAEADARRETQEEALERAAAGGEEPAGAGPVLEGAEGADGDASDATDAEASDGVDAKATGGGAAGPAVVVQTGAGRAASAQAGAEPPGRRPREHGRDDDDDYEPNLYVMRVAWASYLLPPRGRAPRSALRVDETAGAGGRLDIDLSAAVVDDYRARQAWALARAVARAGIKLAITRAVETEAGEKNEAAGRILGAVLNAGAVLSERADIRSWALVPDRLELIRADLPPGEHRLSLETADGRLLELEPVHVARGRTALVFARVEGAR